MSDDTVKKGPWGKTSSSFSAAENLKNLRKQQRSDQFVDVKALIESEGRKLDYIIKTKPSLLGMSVSQFSLQEKLNEKFHPYLPVFERLEEAHCSSDFMPAIGFFHGEEELLLIGLSFEYEKDQNEIAIFLHLIPSAIDPERKGFAVGSYDYQYLETILFPTESKRNSGIFSTDDTEYCNFCLRVGEFKVGRFDYSTIEKVSSSIELLFFIFTHLYPQIMSQIDNSNLSFWNVETLQDKFLQNKIEEIISNQEGFPVFIGY